MFIVRRTALVLGMFVFAQSAMAAPTADHLQCFAIKDSATRALYHADLAPTDPAFAPAAGCVVRLPARLLCVDTVKSNVTPPPPDADPGEPAQQYLCYKTVCPKTQQPTTTAVDQFDTHTLLVKGTALLCAPVTAPTTVTTLPAPSCSDGIQNGNETGTDCGGGTCPPCAAGQTCLGNFDCATGVCTSGVCQLASCADGVKNGNETSADCGGGTCPQCNLGQSCLSGSDCATGTCTGGVCQLPTCNDAIKNGNETSVDCGGGTCPQCNLGQTCGTGSDCASGNCSGGVCSQLNAGSACSSDSQCQTGFCVDGVCCNTSCNGVCTACTAAVKGSGSDGTCGAIAAGLDPANECSDTGAASCGTSGTCSGSGSCTLYSSGTLCAPAFCSGNVANAASLCDGSGTCLSGVQQSCSPYACGATACKTSCSGDSDCDVGYVCLGSACIIPN